MNNLADIERITGIRPRPIPPNPDPSFAPPELPNQPVVLELCSLLRSPDEANRLEGLRKFQSLIWNSIKSQQRLYLFPRLPLPSGEVLYRYWTCMPRPLLHNLLRSQSSSMQTQEAAEDNKHLALTVICAFIDHMDQALWEWDDWMMCFILPLIECLPTTKAEENGMWTSRTMALRALLELVNTRHGAREMAKFDLELLRGLGAMKKEDCRVGEIFVTMVQTLKKKDEGIAGEFEGKLVRCGLVVESLLPGGKELRI